MKVLIVVDMQKDFVDGSLGTKEAQAIVPLVAETIEQMAAKDTVVIFTKDTHEVNYLSTLEGKNLPVEHCIKGTVGHSIVDEVFKAYLHVNSIYKAPWDAYPLAVIDPILIVDDICSKGGTFYHSAKALKAAGAKSVSLYVTHCESSITVGDLAASDGLVDHVYTTKSIFPEKLFKDGYDPYWKEWITVL